MYAIMTKERFNKEKFLINTYNFDIQKYIGKILGGRTSPPTLKIWGRSLKSGGAAPLIPR